MGGWVEGRNSWRIGFKYGNDSQVIIPHVQRWKKTEIATMEEWAVKMVELAEMAKLTCLIWEETTTFLKRLEPLWTFC